MTRAWNTQSHTTDNLHQDLDQEMRRDGPSQVLLGEPPPPFLPVPGEPAMPWDSWQRSFEHYVEALSEPDLTDSSKCALLERCLGRQGQCVYAALVKSGTTYAAAVSTLTIHFSSSHNPQIYRFKFKQRAQRPGESVEQFVTALQELVKPCGFGDLEDQFILDQLIEKTSCVQLRERMLLGLDTSTLANALIIGKQLECALVESTSVYIAHVTEEPEGAPFVDYKDLPIESVTGGERPRRSERLSNRKTHETGAPLSDCSEDASSDGDEVEDQDSDFNDEDYDSGNEVVSFVASDEKEPNSKPPDVEDQACDANGEDCAGDGNTDIVRSKTRAKAHICPICLDRSYSKRSHLVRHMGTHTNEKPFSCPVCAVAFSHSYHMTRHAVKQHGQYICSKCGESLGSQAELETHKMTHAAKVLSCPDCDNKFSGGLALATHRKTHSRVRPDVHRLTCAVCGEKFSTVPKLKRHLVVHNKTSDIKDEPCDATDADYNCNGNKEEYARSKTLHFCPVCTDRSFRLPSRLARHMRMHTKERPYSCPVCAKTFRQCYHMNRHLRKQHYECNVLKGKCHQVSRKQSCDYTVHKNIDYNLGGNEVGENCDTNDLDCDGSGNNEVDVSNILVIDEDYDTSGSGDKKVDCSNILLIDEDGVTNENDNEGGNSAGSCNTAKKEYSCSVCVDRSFSKPSNLARHMATHSKEKPFPCPVCARTFTQSYHMHRHLRNLHFEYSNKKDKDDVYGDEIEGQDSDFNDEDYDSGDEVVSFVASDEKEVANSKHPDVEDQACDANGEDCAGDGNTDIVRSKTRAKAHICPICLDRSYSKRSHLVRHMGTHTNEKPFSCPVCAVAFSRSYHMTRHAVKQHGQYICSKCGESLGSQAEMRTHKMTHAAKSRTYEELSCPDCDNKFSGRFALLNHRKTHSTVRPDFRRLTCTVCGDKFSTTNQLKRHLEVHNVASKSIGLYQCLDCRKSYTHFRDLRNHQELHCNNKSNMDVSKSSLLCGICGKKFTYEYALRNHERRHSEQPFYCSKCDKHFSEPSLYKKHQDFHTRKENLKCPHCKRVSRHITHFKSHLRTHIEERPHQCSCCVESFTQREELELHCLTHRRLKKERPYSCTRCDYAFSSLNELTAHVSLHEGEKPMNCTECGKTFLNKAKLEKHMSMHTAERPHLCSICGSGFLWSSSLRVHMRSHTGEKPYKCSQCSKGFSTASGLKNHSRQHMAVLTRYPCPDCGKSYGRKTELHQHQRSHTGDKPYACTCCNKCFLTQYKRSVHMRTHTGERPYRCSQCGKTFKQGGDRNRHMRKYHQRN